MVKETGKFDWERRVRSTCLANYWSVPKGDTGCLLALAGWYKPLTGFCHKPDEITVEPQSRAPHLLHSHRACHSFTQAHRRFSKAQQTMCSLREQRTRGSKPPYLVLKDPGWSLKMKGCCWMKSQPGFLASGEEFNLGPEMRLDLSELFVTKFY